jgi:hypothetical protein
MSELVGAMGMLAVSAIALMLIGVAVTALLQDF